MKVAGAAKLMRARASLGKRLMSRRSEIEQAILTRVYGVSDTSKIGDPEYAEGLRVAVSVAVDYGIASIEHDDERIPPVPPVLLRQARAAARTGVHLDTVLRRYFAGYAVLGNFLIEEAAKENLLEEAAMKGVLRSQATLFDRLLAAVSEEYAREMDARLVSAEARRIERVERLLAGELVDTATLDYNFDDHHVGIVASGLHALDAIRALSSSLDCRTLIVPHGETTVWAWLGARRRLDSDELQRIAGSRSSGAAIAIGEPAGGLRGWRLTHEQARAALLIAVRKPGHPVRYSDAPLLASMLQDDLLCTSLRELYLEPLERERDGGAVLRQTLNAYITAERNVSSAAALLGISRGTVANRLRSVEAKLDRPLGSVLSQIEAALQLDELPAVPANGRGSRG